MPIFFQRPENALKRANEYIEVGKSQRALEVLYDVIKSKKHRQWSKTHEDIMDKYLQLCVELKKSHTAKEGLYQYKNISQQVSIKSLEDVVRKFLKLAEDKTEAARKTSHQSVVDVDDLDVIETPENLLLSAVSGEDTQDRTDRAILTPWVKFLWESYRQCLDLLRNDSSVEKLYQDIAQQAFKFCLNYGRKTEFRKLCDSLRTHLGHIHKHQHKTRAINLNNPESQAMHLETRMVQLDNAIQMELWQEAFKAIEDIHGLVILSKKPPKPALLASYYSKVALVFWKSGNLMFHAAAYHRLFHLYKEQKKNVTESELQKYATKVICATLAVPIPPSRNAIDALLEQDEGSLERQKRLATLLNLPAPPNRANLVKDLVKYNVIGHVKDTKLHDLYRWLEVDFHPLKLADRIAEPMEFIASDKNLKQYTDALQNTAITRLVKQISQVYQSIEMHRLASLAPFSNPHHLEKVIVSCAKDLDLQVRIDHKSKSLSFGTDLGVSQKEDVPEGPYLQSMPSEQIRNQLILMAQSLDKAAKIIHPVDKKREELASHIVQTYRQVARKEHARILQRRQIIEERKEELENINVQKEMEEEKKLEEERRRQYEAEKARLEKEAEERDRQRKLQEHRDIQKKVAKERLDQLKSTHLGQKAFEDMTEDDIVKMDMDDILAKQVEQIEKQKRELQEKLRAQEKKVDYFERAKRIEELPLLVEHFEEWLKKDRQLWEDQEEERIKEEELKHKIAIETYQRMARMVDDKDVFLTQLRESKKSHFEEKVNEFEAMLEIERQERLEERRVARKAARKEQWEKQREEERQLRIDEQLKKEREEEERKAQEQKEKEEAEYKERLRKLELIEEKKRQREAEIERRQKEEEAPPSKPAEDGRWRRGNEGEAWRGSRGPASDASRPAGGGWREREKNRENDRDRDFDRDRDRERERPMGRDRDDRPPPEDNWRRGGSRQQEDGGGWRRSNEGEGWRGGRGPAGPDGGRSGGGGWRDRERDRDLDRDQDRDRGGRDRPPADDSWRRSSNRPQENGGGWRRSNEGEGWRGGRGSAGPDGGRSGGGGGGWRDRERDRDQDRDRGGRDRPPADDSWRRSSNRAPAKNEEDDGNWTKVRR